MRGNILNIYRNTKVIVPLRHVMGCYKNPYIPIYTFYITYIDKHTHTNITLYIYCENYLHFELTKDHYHTKNTHFNCHVWDNKHTITT